MILKTTNKIYDFLEIKKSFSVIDDSDIYDYLIDLGKLISPIEDKYKTSDNKVYGCQSNVWIAIDNNNIYVDSDSVIVKGLLHVILSIILSQNFSNHIKESNNYIIECINSIGLTNHLSSFRKTGIIASIEKISNILKTNT